MQRSLRAFIVPSSQSGEYCCVKHHEDEAHWLKNRTSPLIHPDNTDRKNKMLTTEAREILLFIGVPVFISKEISFWAKHYSRAKAELRKTRL